MPVSSATNGQSLSQKTLDITLLLRIPIYLAGPDRTSETSEWISVLGWPDIRSGYAWIDGQSPWSNRDLTTAIQRENRPMLFIGGFWLEDSITFSALGGLADGYDVHVMLDVAVAHREETRDAAVERLMQARMVRTTTFQVVSEWTATVDDAEIRVRLSTAT